MEKLWTLLRERVALYHKKQVKKFVLQTVILPLVENLSRRIIKCQYFTPLNYYFEDTHFAIIDQMAKV